MVLFNILTTNLLFNNNNLNDKNIDEYCEDFYKKIENENTYDDMVNLFKHYEYILLKNKRFLFVARIKFAKKYCNKIFNKNYNELKYF